MHENETNKDRFLFGGKCMREIIVQDVTKLN